MIKQVLFGLKDVKKNSLIILIFIFQLSIILVFSFLIFTNLLYNLNYSNTLNKLNQLSLVNYTISYPDKYYDKSSLSQTLLKSCFNSGDAYTFIEGVSVNEASNVQTIITIGATDKLYNFNFTDKPYTVFIGSEVDALDVGQKITIGTKNKIELTIDERFNNNTMFLRNTYLSDLNNYIVINLSFNDFFETFYLEGPIKYSFYDHLVLVNVDDVLVHEITKEINSNNGLLAYPRDYNSMLKRSNTEQLFNTLFFCVLILIVFFFTFVGIVCNTLNLIDKNLKTYAIHMMAGCTLIEIYSRLMSYLFCITIPPIIFSSTIINYMGILKLPFINVIILILLVTLVLSLIPIYTLKNSNMLSFLRGN